MTIDLSLPPGFAATACTVFILGLRHGADPDHLAAIDNLTRNGLSARRALARFAGTLFAGGHSLVVLAIASCAGLLGSRLASHGGQLEALGGWISVIMLFWLAALNLRQLRAGASTPAGLKTALIPRSLRASGAPLAAIPIGMLFGLGFDTSSQLLAYGLAFAAGGGLAAAAIVGVAFSSGMAVTDTLDSMLVYRLCAGGGGDPARGNRIWIAAVTTLALLVGLYELAQMSGWRSPISDLDVSGALVASLLLVFLICCHSRPAERTTEAT